MPLVGNVADGERQERAVRPIRELDVHHAVAGVHEGRQILDAVLDPLHGATRRPREESADQEVGRPPLVAEAAADVGAGEPDA